jgi:zinc protease
VAEAFVRQVRMREAPAQAGVATLTGLLLDEGTTTRSGQQISQLIEDVGGSLTMASSGGEVQVLSPDRALGLELLFDCLLRSSFPQDAFDRQKQRQLSQIEDGERQPDAKAQRVFQALVYGAHPYGRPHLGTRTTVEKLTRQDCALFHRLLFVPENMIVAIVGDFDSNQMIKEVKRLSADDSHKRLKLNSPQHEAPAMPLEFTQKILTMPQAEQLHFYMGHPGVRRTDPNYYKLLVMDYVLGTGPGFTDRLSARLRDREGLAYTVSATITSSASEEPGLFTCYIGTEPKNFARVKQTFLEELTRLRTALPTKSEVEDAKKYLLGSLPFQLTTNSRVAGHLLAIERYQLGFDYFEKYQQAVAAVTPNDVKAMAEQYLDPKRMVLVAAGPLNAGGKVLPPTRGGE